jgi:nitrate reductase gamma subunit
MTDHGDFVGHDDRSDVQPETWWRPAYLLTPKACATAAFALAVFSILGQGSWSLAAQSLFASTIVSEGDYDVLVALAGLPSLALAVGAVLLARRTLLQPRSVLSSWEDHLARASVLVAALGGLLGLLTLLGAAV